MMRILLMFTIPVYHLMVYNGVFFVDNTNAILALVLSVGGAIPADYAFMAMSSYFFLETKNRPIVKRFLFLGAQVLTLYVIKVITLRGLFGYHNTEYFIDFFLMRGAWWYIYPYLLLSLFYPILNRVIDGMKKERLYLLTGILGLVLFLCSVKNKGNFGEDVIAFLFTYFFMGCLKRGEYQRFFGVRICRRNMTILVLIGYLLLLFLALTVKTGFFGDFFEENAKILRFLIGRYQIISVFMGYAVFFLFRDLPIPYRKSVHILAGWTMYVFLLHDAWMGVFWYFGVCENDLGSYSLPAFIFWTLCYLVTSFFMAGLIKKIYDKCLLPLWSRGIQKICQWSVIRKWDEKLCQM